MASVPPSGPPSAPPLRRVAALAGAAALAAALGAPAAAQDPCYADYRAKQDEPLRLHYGTAEVPSDCTVDAATGALASRLEAAGWTLLDVLSVFGADGLATREGDAGEFHLRF